MTLSNELESRAFVENRCDTASIQKIEAFIELLTDEQSRQNLIATSTISHVWRRHIADSIQLLDLVPEVPRGTWVDLGTGAGLPGLIIAIARPEFHVRLIESRRLRSDWLSRCIAKLDLPNCEVLHARVEGLPAEKAGVISARAFAPLPKTIELGRRFSTADTVWLLPKGRSAAQEVAQLPTQLRNAFHVEQSVTDGEAGIVIGQLMENSRS